MNILINPNNINIQNIFYTDTKSNIIMDGNFTKMIYSNAIFSMIGLFISFPICPENILRLPNKYMLVFEPYSNKDIIQKFIDIESIIIYNYMQFFDIVKTPSYNLKIQLMKGIIKIYKENLEHLQKQPQQYYIKISGIWESLNEVGITYKIIEY